MTDQHDLDGQWAVILGASEGIGFGVAEALFAGGASVALVARGADALESRRQQLWQGCRPGQHVRTECADASDPESMSSLFERLDRDLPSLNVYVANAGAATVTPLVEIALEEWQGQLALNLTGTFLGVQWAARRMMRADPRSNRAILLVSSVRAVGARAGMLAYSATKAAVNQLARVAALELAPHGVRVNVLSPGLTATTTAIERAPEIFAARLAEVPLGRTGSPDDMGAAVRYLCGPAAAFVTGANLVVDGGQSLR
jgi:glucose 1-dehydrogenase